MRLVLRIGVVILALAAVGMYVLTAVNAGTPFGWLNSWQWPAIAALALTIVVFVLTLRRSGTRGSVLDDLGAAMARPKLSDPVEGVAQVVTASGQPRSGQNMGSAMCELNLVITVPGQPSVAAHTASMVRLAQWPTTGVRLPVLAERTDPTRFRILWERVGTGWDVGMQQAQALADQMNAQADQADSGERVSEAGGAASFDPSSVPPGAKIVRSSVSINGRPASPDEIAAYESLTGMDLNGDGVVGKGDSA